LNPKWNQFWDAVADHANGQRLIVEVFDEDPAGEDEFLGRISVGLDYVRAKGMLENWFPLEGCKQGDIHLAVQWFDLAIVPTNDIEKIWKELDERAAAGAKTHAVLLVFVDRIKNLQGPRPGVMPISVVELDVGEIHRESMPKGGTNDPVFQQKFLFTLINPRNEILTVKIMDSAAKVKLGEVKVPVNQVLQTSKFEIRQQIFPLPNKAELIMTVQVRLLKPKIAVT